MIIRIAPRSWFGILAFVGWLGVAFTVFTTCAAAHESQGTEAPYFFVTDRSDGADLLPLKSTEARVELVGSIALVKITQVYANVGSIPINAVYVFPGSTQAAVQGLEMRVGDRLVKAEIRRKIEARRAYEEARAEGKTASLLEQHRPNVFQMNLANVLPGDVVEVSLFYSEWIAREKEEYVFVLPLVVGPRYSSPGAGVAAEEPLRAPYLPRDVGSASGFELSLRLAASVPVESIQSSSHAIAIERRDEATLDVLLTEDPLDAADRDFVLRFKLAGEALKSGLLLSESGEERYFLANLEPPASSPESRASMPREYFFIVDVSGSMRGFPLEMAKRSMELLTATLTPEDRFNLLLFSGSAAVLASQPLPATPANLSMALDFLERQYGGGSTELLPAMEAAYATPRDPNFSRSIVILTDGYVTVEQGAFELVRQRLNEANVFAIGIGSSVNRYLIEGLARVGQGETFFVTTAGDVEDVANRFVEYVSAPILSQIEIHFDGFDAYDVEPLAVPDLLADRPIAVFGKWKGPASGAIRMSGRIGREIWEQALEVEEANDLGHDRSLELIWARARVRRLSDYNRLWPDGDRALEVTRLGLKHGLLTQYTSFVAVDHIVRRDPSSSSREIAQPLPLPRGVTGSAIDPGQPVPVTPEPRTTALIFCLFVVVGWMLWRESRRGMRI